MRMEVSGKCRQATVYERHLSGNPQHDSRKPEH